MYLNPQSYESPNVVIKVICVWCVQAIIQLLLTWSPKSWTFQGTSGGCRMHISWWNILQHVVWVRQRMA